MANSETNNPPVSRKPYYKKSGNAGVEGTEYQISLLAIFLLNGLRRSEEWYLSTENDDAGKLDDVVFESADGNIFLQAKHKQNKKHITSADLLSINAAHDDFSLPKYFFSYIEIAKTFKIKNVIICTNIDFKVDVDFRRHTTVNKKNLVAEDMLYYEEGNSSVYTLNHTSVNSTTPSPLKQSLENYYKKNMEELQKKGIEEEVISDKNLENYLNCLQILVKYPSKGNLDTVIKQLILETEYSKKIDNETAYIYIYKKIEDWFKQIKKADFLTKAHARAFFYEILRNEYCNMLDKSDIYFKENDLPVEDSNKKVWHLVPQENHLVTLLKIYRTLQQRNLKEFLLIAPQCNDGMMELVIDAFGVVSKYTHLIILYDENLNDSITDEMCLKIKVILDNSEYKKLILVCEDDNPLAACFEETDFYEVVEEEIKCCHVTEETREKIRNKRNIIFQGDMISLTELLAPSDEEVLNGFVDAAELVKYVIKKNIKVGSKVEALSEYIKSYYIPRTFNLNGNDISEGRICELTTNRDNKIILISDAPGMGKTTVVTQLANIIKENNPNLWVIKVNINNYAKVLSEFLENGKRCITLPQLLDSQDETKLQSAFEKKLFSFPQRVVLIIDGVDEICPDYKELVLSLIMDCMQKPNYAKIYITTRPHVGEELERELKVESLKLSPFSKQNQSDFLCKYWKRHLGLKKSAQTKKCLTYAQELIREINIWINDHNNTLPEIPLQTRMLAEIFQERQNLESDGLGDWEGCKEFLTSKDEVPKFPRKINLVELYQLFMAKKRYIFMHDKSMLTGNVITKDAVKKVYNECELFHKKLALESILGKHYDYVKLWNCYTNLLEREPEEENVVKLGIVQKTNDQYHFIHRTFAEFHVAQCLIFELNCEYKSEEFQIFFTDHILTSYEYKIIRSFLNSFLQNEFLPDEVIKAFSSLDYNSELYEGYKTFFQVLSEEGCIYLLEFFFKCLSLAKAPLEINRTRDDFGKLMLHHAAREGQTDMVEFLIEKGADVNVEDDYGETPLHDAVSKSQLHTSRMLLKHGASVNRQGYRKRTPLHAAFKLGNVDIVKMLLEEGADIRIVDRDGLTVLHEACHAGFTKRDVIQVLVASGADIHSKTCYGFTPLHMACMWPKLNVVKFLVDNGANVNEQNVHGDTALHITAEQSMEIPELVERFHLEYQYYVDISKYLVENKADINITNNKGRTALHSAVHERGIPILTYLLEISHVDSADKEGNTALHIAVEDGHLHIATFLIENGANVNIRNKYGRFALHGAAQYNRQDIVEYLIEVGAQADAVDYNGRTALHSDRLNLDVMKFLIGKGISIHVKDTIFGRTILHYTILYYGNPTDHVKHLLEAGADINVEDEQGRTPLYYALEINRIELAEYLIASGATVENIDKEGRTVLHKAARREDWFAFKFLLKQKIEANAKDNQGRTVLHEVCTSLDTPLDLVEALVDGGAEVNVEDNLGRTPFHDSIATSSLELIAFLIRRGSNVNARDAKGSTPLLTANSEDNCDKVKLLLDNGADINTRDNAGNTILMLAVDLGYLDMVKILIEYKADVNLANGEGWTALHVSSRWNYLDKVRYLLENNANVNIEDNDGCTALHIAARPNRLEVVMCLIAKGANVNARNKKGETPLQLALERECLYEEDDDSLLDVMRFLMANGGICSN